MGYGVMPDGLRGVVSQAFAPFQLRRNIETAQKKNKRRAVADLDFESLGEGSFKAGQQEHTPQSKKLSGGEHSTETLVGGREMWAGTVPTGGASTAGGGESG